MTLNIKTFSPAAATVVPDSKLAAADTASGTEAQAPLETLTENPETQTKVASNHLAFYANYGTNFAGSASNGLPEAEPNDLPSAATATSLTRMPSAKTVSTAVKLADVGADTFAMACAEAGFVRGKADGAQALQTYLDGFQSPELKNAMQGFLTQHTSANDADWVDGNGNFKLEVLTQAKAAYGQAAAQNSAMPTAPSASQNAQTVDTSKWPRVNTETDAYQTYSQWSQTATYPAVQAAAKTVVTNVDKLQQAQATLNDAQARLTAATQASPQQAGDAQGVQRPLSFWQEQQRNAANALQTAWQDTRTAEGKFWAGLNVATLNAADAMVQKYVKDPLFTTEGSMSPSFTSTPLPK